MAVEQAAQAAKDVANGAVNAGKGLFRGLLKLPTMAFDLVTSKPVLFLAGAAALSTIFMGVAAAPAVAKTLAALPEPGTLGGIFSNAVDVVGSCWSNGPAAVKTILAPAVA